MDSVTGSECSLHTACTTVEPEENARGLLLMP